LSEWLRRLTRRIQAGLGSLALALSLHAQVRYTPMEGAPRSLHLALGSRLHAAFDTELLRVHTAWLGPGLNVQGTPHTGNKTPFFSEPRGTIFHTTHPVQPWSAEPPASTPATGRVGAGQFVAWSEVKGFLHLEYRVHAGGTESPVQELLRPLGGFDRGFARALTVMPGENSLWWTPVAEFIATGEIRQLDAGAIAIQRTNDWLLIARELGGDSLDALFATTNDLELVYEVERERGGDNERVEVREAGRFARISQHFPPRAQPLQLAFVTVALAELPADSTALLRRLRASLADTANPDPCCAIAPLTVNATLSASAGSASPPGGDAHYAIESFPLPPEVALKVTGLAWLPNGDLAVCTWPGEVWIVEQAQGPATGVRYRRFARGLNEPLGLVVVSGDLVVAQKPELTRLRDTDGDGVADRYECLNDDWDFTGNYHAFTFGPALAEDGSYLLAFCGQRARWDVTYASWLVRIAADGSKVEPLAGGLRAPNGLGFFGPNRDLFVTDNQGNWIGASKLNHVRSGHTYGYPAARPATRAQWDQPSADFDPPAVWFPRKLAPSPAGFATIPENGFGPFGGQLVVADFQNATVLRVALEQVNGRWQGAVFPFLKNFGSGANRVLFDPQGRLYVGGVKNQAWPSAGPFEQALERVRFTGKMPFEIQHVRAQPDGFELTFTAPVNREFAGDPDSYFASQFNYRHHQEYGSPEFDHDGKPGSATTIKITAAEVSADGRRVRLRLSGWKTGYATRVVASALESDKGEFLRSDEFYYTLNSIPAE
jgi:glucose/arabinose dehydrogenase